MEDFDDDWIEHEAITNAVEKYLGDRSEYWVGSARQQSATSPITISLEGSFTADQLRHIAGLIDSNAKQEG